MRKIVPLLLLCAAPLPLAAAQAQPAPAATAMPAMPANYGQLTQLFTDWRRFITPQMRSGVADYSAAAMARMAAELPQYRQRLDAIDRTGWPASAQVDYKVVLAEMNGLDFDMRVLKPWARDPTFYASFFPDWSDVPAHEGPYAYPNINLYEFKYPLNAADDRRLTAMLAALPAQLAAAKVNLAESNAKDLWTYGDRAFREQADALGQFEAGTLVLRTLEGRIPATITGASPALRRAIRGAKTAMEEFATYVAAEAPKKTGQTGVGKENYNWHLANVQMVPYTWDDQVALLRRELDRSVASMRLEELRNRRVAPITEISDPAAFRRAAEAKTERFHAFMVDAGFATDAPWSKAAIAAQTSTYTAPGDRNFFSHVTAADPLPLLTHASHWMELARLKNEPPASPIRRMAPMFNNYSNRSEGFATAWEEIVMQAGLYDDIPHGRELVWIMLANRAARGLASLYVQSNEWDLAQAGRFHAEWTPRGWSDPQSPLVGFEQLLYARQPGYGPSYVIGKLQLDRLMAEASFAADKAKQPFVMKDFMTRMYASGIVPVGMIGEEMGVATPK